MSNNTSSNPLAKFYCNTFGHNYEMTKKVTLHVKEYTCKCCKKQLTTDSNGNLTELTPKFEEINMTLSRIYNSRSVRSKKKLIASSIY